MGDCLIYKHSGVTHTSFARSWCSSGEVVGVRVVRECGDGMTRDMGAGVGQ